MITWMPAAAFRPTALTHEACPVCEAAIGPAAAFVRYDPFVLVLCPDCGFVFVGNPLAPAELDDYYRNSFARDNEAAYHAMQRDNARTNMRWLRRHAPIAAALRGGARPTALDAGAGFGYLLAQLQPWGFDGVGIEPSPFQRRFGEERLGVRFADQSLETLADRGDRFDLITLCDVIEHIVQPRPLLATCARLLKPEGRLVVKTDNFQGTVARLMGLHFYRQSPIEHVSQFSPAVLDRLATAVGLRSEATFTWTPASAMRWAVKFRVVSALGRQPPLPDPKARSQVGRPPSRLAEMTSPLFALATIPIDRLGRGVEFMMILKRDSRC